MQPVIASARGAFLVDAAGREYLDFSMGYGSVWLGHGDAGVAQAVEAQLRRHAAPGFFSSGAFERAEAALAPLLPESHFLGGLYSTGMEAVEAAVRAAWAHTGRLDLAALEGSEHGRSYLASALGGRGRLAPPPFVHTVPSLLHPEELMEHAEGLARRTALAALIVEPIQMTGGGHALDAATARRLQALSREHGFALVFDEALTAPYRSGRALYADAVGVVPDILVLGKGLGNGFPCAAVALRRGYAWDRARVRPGSTFWNHPLACAAAAATLDALRALGPIEKVERIEQVVRKGLGHLRLRGRGAMWTLELPDPAGQAAFVERLLQAGVVASYYAGHVRLLPPMTIVPSELEEGCARIRDAYEATFGADPLR